MSMSSDKIDAGNMWQHRALDIPGWEGQYAVSDDGRVWSHKTNQEIKRSPDKYGYYTVGLYDGKRIKRVKVHRLVATVYIENEGQRPQVNHKNGVKTDNRVENLEWVTPLGNSRHAWRTGLMDHVPRRGEENAYSKLSEADVIEIKRRLSSGDVTQRALAKEYGVHFATISAISVGKSWSHI